MSRVPDETVAQAASVPFVPSGGDQTGVVLQRWVDKFIPCGLLALVAWKGSVGSSVGAVYGKKAWCVKKWREIWTSIDLSLI